MNTLTLEKTTNYIIAGMLAMMLLLVCEPSFAGAVGGLDKAETFLGDIKEWLIGLAAVIVTLAFVWVGYQIIFNSAGFRDVARVVAGALLIGFAGTMASLLIA